MATIKFTDSTTPSKFTLAKKQYEVTCGHQVTNSDFLNLLLDGYLVTSGIPSEVTTGLPSNHTEVTTSIPSGIPSEFVTKSEYDFDMKQISDFNKTAFDHIKKIYAKLSKLEAPVDDIFPEY
jgi:hypothetical protein